MSEQEEKPKKHYPSFRHHATKKAVVVHNEAEDKALGKEWGETPLHVGKETHPQRGHVASPLEEAVGSAVYKELRPEKKESEDSEIQDDFKEDKKSKKKSKE